MKPEILKSLKDQLSYDKDSGLFYWKVKKNSFGGCINIGSIAGSPKDRYVQIYVYLLQLLIRLSKSASFYLTKKRIVKRLTL